MQKVEGSSPFIRFLRSPCKRGGFVFSGENTPSGVATKWQRTRSEQPLSQGHDRCTVVLVWLAGIPVADKIVLRLAADLREAELVDTAEILERAYDHEARIVALDIPDREAILRVLEGAPRTCSSCGRRFCRSTFGARAKGSARGRSRERSCGSPSAPGAGGPRDAAAGGR